MWELFLFLLGIAQAQTIQIVLQPEQELAHENEIIA
jgi:hypothetical protein